MVHALNLGQGGAVRGLPQQAVLATMHGKEAALAPAFAGLGVDLVIPEGFDSDRFGTFGGEIARTGTMEEAARAKLAAAMAQTGLAAGMASEGAYGPHPVVPFLASGREILVWRNKATGQEIVEEMLDAQPVYDHMEAADLDGVAALLARVDFPKTALIVAPASRRTAPIGKGLRHVVELDAAIRLAVQQCPLAKAFVQTDMRAFMNPRRMAIIAELGRKLAARLATACPNCQAPGWGKLRSETGLPCSGCGLKTDLVACEVHGCIICGAQSQLPRRDGKAEADPSQCQFCNP